MKEILSLCLLGIIAGLFSIFWTRIISDGMILGFISRKLHLMNMVYVRETGKGYGSPFVNFVKCMFCITPYLFFLLALIYVIIYTPAWYNIIIGVIGGLGAGNVVCEVIFAIRGGL